MNEESALLALTPGKTKNATNQPCVASQWHQKGSDQSGGMPWKIGRSASNMNREKILYCIWQDGERRHLFGSVGLAVVENVDSDDNGELL